MELIEIYFTFDDDDYEQVAYIEGTEEQFEENYALSLLKKINSYKDNMNFNLEPNDRKNKFLEDLLTGQILEAHIGQFENNGECIDYQFRNYKDSLNKVKNDWNDHYNDKNNASFELADESKFPLNPEYFIESFICNFNSNAKNPSEVFKIMEA